jgi:hypothetical protein
MAAAVAAVAVAAVVVVGVSLLAAALAADVLTVALCATATGVRAADVSRGPDCAADCAASGSAPDASTVSEASAATNRNRTLTFIDVPPKR